MNTTLWQKRVKAQGKHSNFSGALKAPYFFGFKGEKRHDFKHWRKRIYFTFRDWFLA